MDKLLLVLCVGDDNFDYLKTRKSEDLDKYKIKDRKKTYKANKKNWRQYLKTIK